MEFTLEFYESPDGRSPVQAFLDELKSSDPGDHQAVLAGLARLRDRQNHRAPLTKALAGGLLELRHVGKLNTRVIWFFARGRRIVLVHGVRNKGQGFASRDLAVAESRMKDWNRRHPK
jgi:phage-related protein